MGWWADVLPLAQPPELSSDLKLGQGWKEDVVLLVIMARASSAHVGAGDGPSVPSSPHEEGTDHAFSHLKRKKKHQIQEKQRCFLF